MLERLARQHLCQSLLTKLNPIFLHIAEHYFDMLQPVLSPFFQVLLRHFDLSLHRHLWALLCNYLLDPSLLLLVPYFKILPRLIRHTSGAYFLFMSRQKGLAKAEHHRLLHTFLALMVKHSIHLIDHPIVELYCTIDTLVILLSVIHSLECCGSHYPVRAKGSLVY